MFGFKRSAIKVMLRIELKGDPSESFCEIQKPQEWRRHGPRGAAAPTGGGYNMFHDSLTQFKLQSPNFLVFKFI